MFGYKMKTKYMYLGIFLFCFSLVATENLKNHFFCKGTKGSVFLKKVSASPHIMRKKRMVKY